MADNQTFVAMKLSAGTVPTQIHLPDASTIYPDYETGQVMCPAKYVMALMVAGWGFAHD